MSNFSFKGDTLYRLIPSVGIDLFIPQIVLWGDTISRDTGIGIKSTEDHKSNTLNQLTIIFNLTSWGLSRRCPLWSEL